MAFWSNNRADVSEPLRQHRWYMSFKSNLDCYRFALKSCTKPEYDLGISEHVLLNHTFRYPKNITWKPITVKMAAVTNSTGTETNLKNKFLTSHLYEMLNFSGYARPGSKLSSSTSDVQTNISKKQTIEAVSSGEHVIDIAQLDSNGFAIEIFKLYNPMINNIKFGSLSYESENIVDIDLSIVYDYAILFANRYNLPYENPDTLTNTVDDSGLNIRNIEVLGIDLGLTNPFTLPSEAERKRISPGFPNGKNR